MISPSEIITLALSRNVSPDHIRTTDIQVAEWEYVRGYIGADLYALVKENKDNAYDSFIDEYVKPVLSYGVVFNIFERLTSEISDRGVVQMLSEGATVMDAESRFRSKQEFLNSLVVYLEIMTKYLDDSDDAKFADYEDQGYEYGFQSKPYVNRNQL